MKNKFFRMGLAALVGSAALGFAAPAANAAATFVIVNIDGAGEGFNDPTAVAPVGGNPGTTIGQQRLNVFQAAANVWGATLTSSVTIQIRAAFNPLTCTATSAVLGSAGARWVDNDFAPGIKPGTLYPGALANKYVGFDEVPTEAEINAQFNSNLGQPGCLTGVPFYYGLDNNHGTNIDLFTVLLHEFGHGLGFQTFTDASTGAPFAGFPSIWDHYLKDQTLGKTWVAMTNAERAFSATNNGKLVWTGAGVTTALPGVLSLGVPQLSVGGPASGGTAGVYAVGTGAFGTLTSPGVTSDIMPIANDPIPPGSPPGTLPAQGCVPFTALNALAVKGNVALIDRGTCAFTLKAKNAQNAGAVGVIIANNAAGAPPPGMGGTDPTIVIPVALITQGDANLIRSALTHRSRTKSGVSGTLSLNTTRYAGADPSGFALLYAPVPFSGGSSVSHFDVSATRNLLMEPAINVDLTHSVVVPQDLTFELLKDIGW